MRRFPKFFSLSSDRRKSRVDTSFCSSSSSSSSCQAAKPKRLDRCYAVKNIDYEFSPASASSSSYSQEESLRTLSLDLYGGKTSFRVDGTEGEFEFICQTFGFSGVDDFAISQEEYESMKVKSSSVPALFSQNVDAMIYRKIEVNCADVVECSDGSGGAGVVDMINRKIVSSDVVSTKFEDSCDVGCIDRCRDSVIGTELSKRLEDVVRIDDMNFNDKVSGRSNVLRGNGIKGMKPTLLVPPPASRGFLLDSDACVSGFEGDFYLDKNTERAERVGVWNVQEKDMEIRVLSESSSFSLNDDDDDDSSSTVTEPMSNISSNERYRCAIENWQKGDLLGRGSFGSVYEGIADDGFFFAVKEVSLLDQGNEGKQCIIQLEQEIALLSRFEHENIVRYYGTKRDESHLYIFLELVTKGSLLSLYQKYELRRPLAAAYTRQILHGLKYLHDRNVIHRDIKCANILVHTNGLVKLADFGLAKSTKVNDVKSCKGTAYWMAPEVVRSRGYGLPADIWSLGCTVLEMLTRRFPYSNLEDMSALYRIGQGKRPHIPYTLSSDARNFILECLQADPSLRPTAAQLLDHPFVKRSLTSSSSTGSPRSFGRQI